MAKELPYFKYFPSEWVTGDITLCSMDTQGIFINICCFYWMKNCSISLANAKQRFSKHEANINELLKQNILKVDSDENIIINFLDEQMNEFINVSEKRAIAGAKGGKAIAKQMLSKRKAKAIYKDKEEDKDLIIVYSLFYDEQLKISNNDEKYKGFIEYIFGKNPLERKFNKILSMKDQVTFDQFLKIQTKISFFNQKINNQSKNISLKELIESYENGNYKKDSFYLTFNTWINKSAKNNNIKL